MAAMQASTTKTVTIRGGTYSLAGSSITFSSADTGETWIPYPNETVIIDGGGSGYVYTSSANNLTIEGLTFRNLGVGVNTNGGTGLVLLGTGLTIRWNTFLNCNQMCISGSALYSVIDSNIFNGQSPGNPAGLQYVEAFAAIELYSSPENVQISHNLIENTQGGGIYLAGDYNRPMVNNVIDRNMLINVNSNVVDMGAIYVIDTPHTGTGNTITNNVINGYGGASYQSNITKALYIDNHTSNILVQGNIIRGSGTFAIEIHGGDHVSLINNVFDFSTAQNQWGGGQIVYQDFESGSQYGMAGNLFSKNIVFFSGGPVPAALWWDDIPWNAAGPNVVNNLYYSASGGAVPTAPDTNPAFANPGFTNPSAGDYSLSVNSPAFSMIGWSALPADQGPVANPFTTSQGGGGSTTCPPSTAAATARHARALSWTAHPTGARDAAKATNLIWKGKGRPRLVASEGDGRPRMIMPSPSATR
jgi:hypothetical protein